MAPSHSSSVSESGSPTSEELDWADAMQERMQVTERKIADYNRLPAALLDKSIEQRDTILANSKAIVNRYDEAVNAVEENIDNLREQIEELKIEGRAGTAALINDMLVEARALITDVESDKLMLRQAFGVEPHLLAAIDKPRAKEVLAKLTEAVNKIKADVT